MLPVLRVQSLLRVADDRYLSETLRYREKMRDSQTDRDLTGFYVYQNYLKRLRRLHRNYVKQQQQQQQQQQRQQGQQQLQQQHQQLQQQRRRRYLQEPTKHPLFLPNCHLKTERSLLPPTAVEAAASSSKHDWPRTKFRLEASQSQNLSLRLGKNYWHQPETAASTSLGLPPVRKKGLPPITNCHAVTEEKEEEEEEEEEVEEEGETGRKDEPIYIPCGRENSELRLQKLQKRKDREKERNGALSFRMWRSVHGLSGTPYST